MSTATSVLQLQGTNCGEKFDFGVERHVCICGKPLFAYYGLKRAAETLTLKNLARRPRTHTRAGYKYAAAWQPALQS